MAGFNTYDYLERGVIVARGEMAMNVSYKKLWKLLIDKDMKKTYLQEQTGISWTSLAKMSRNEPVSMGVLSKICKVLEANIGDVVDFVDEEKDNA